MTSDHPDREPEADEEQPYSADTREAQEAHGGSMAPGAVDPVGRPLEQPPQAEIIDEEAGRTDE